MPPKTLAEKTWFKADGAETDEEKNAEIGSEKGWRATYRE